MLVTYGLILLGVAVVRFVVGVGRRLATRQGQPRHRVRPAQPHVGAPAPAARLSYFDRWPTGQLMSRADERRAERAHVPRLRPRLLHHQHRDDGRRRRHPASCSTGSWRCSPWRSCRPAAGHGALQPEAAADPQGRAAEDRRRDRGGRGERGGLAHRAHLRARGRRAREVQRPQLQGLRGQRGRGARARRVHPADRLHPQPGRGLPAVLRRPAGDRRADEPGLAGRLLQLPDDVRVPGPGDRLAHRPGAARHRQRRARVRDAGRAAGDGGAAGRAAAARAGRRAPPAP